MHITKTASLVQDTRNLSKRNNFFTDHKRSLPTGRLQLHGPAWRLLFRVHFSDADYASFEHGLLRFSPFSFHFKYEIFLSTNLITPWQNKSHWKYIDKRTLFNESLFTTTITCQKLTELNAVNIVFFFSVLLLLLFLFCFCFCFFFA